MVKDTVSFSDFQKLDFRVGKVLTVEEVIGSTNLIRMQVDLGKEYGKRKIIAGIAKWYTPKKLKGKKFLFLANLAPKQMMKELSNGMIICADLENEASLIPIDDKIPEGTVVR